VPRTIEDGFNDFLVDIKATATESAATVSHRASIEQCLRANFGLNRFVRIGSFGNGTNVSTYSDVDYLACIPTVHLTKSSSYSMGKVRDALATRFPSTGICVRTPTVYCPFGTYRSQDTEVTVADYVEEISGFKIYEIADGNDGWMRVCPDAHNAYVKAVNEQHGGKVKPLIRFIKAWKFYQNVPISSFYLEMRVAKYASQESAIVYDIDVRNILQQLRDGGLAAMHDPMGFSGYINPCRSTATHAEAYSKLCTAATRAEKAREAENNLDTKNAFEWWQLLYNNKFTNYYY
jgi:hypothetical protein